MKRVWQWALVVSLAVAGMARAEVEPVVLPTGVVSSESVMLVVTDLRRATGEECTEAGKTIDGIVESPDGRLKEYFAALGAERDKLASAGLEIILTTAMPGDFGEAMPAGKDAEASMKTVAMVRLKAGADVGKATAALNAARGTIHGFEVRLAEESAKQAGATSQAAPKKPAEIKLAAMKDAGGWHVMEGEGFAAPYGSSEANEVARSRMERAFRPFSDAPVVALFNMTEKLRDDAKAQKAQGIAMVEMLEGAQGLECGAAALYMGKNPRLALQLHMTDEKKAETMRDALNRVVLSPSLSFLFMKPADKEDPLHVQITKLEELSKGVVLKQQGRIVSGGCDAEQVKAISAVMKEIGVLMGERIK